MTNFVPVLGVSDEMLASGKPLGDIETRAAEIADFLGIPEQQAFDRLSKGFGYQHQRVNDDFRQANPQTDDELLDWYRTTPEYIWELSAYHADPGFNYTGMCAGIAARLKAEKKYFVLCLGDGIGDLTLSLYEAGFDAFYHDLEGSKTAQFAKARIDKVNAERAPDTLRVNEVLTNNFYPAQIQKEADYGILYDAIISLDFLEHVTDVPVWCAAIRAALRPGGLFCAQNAFDCGSGPDGAIPCHLAINDKYAHAASHTNGKALWDHLLIEELGFRQESSNWYRKVA